MKLHSRFTFLLALVLLLVASAALAQTNASLSGTVTSEGKPLPGVTVTVSSPNMQGVRTTVTGEAGGYSLAGLPPGDYTVVIELEGLQKVTKHVQIGVGQTGRADADLKVAAVSEAITVTATPATVLESPTVATNISQEQVNELPIGRTVLAAAQLAPGVNTNTSASGQLSISGSPGYDNLVMVNGVAITEMVRSQALPLFVEDAIQETTVMTGAISAEYGRFTGGVVNSITKSGGNQFSGSFRDSLNNDAWTAENPNQVINGTQNRDKLNSVYEATLGGYVLRDRLWFFVSGRKATTDSTVSTRAVPGTTISLTAPSNNDETRYEPKLTAQITPKHSITASYLKRSSKSTNTQFTTASYDLESLTDRQDPIKLFSGFYNGVLTNNLLVEAHYAAMDYKIGVGSGSKFTDPIRGTIVRNLADGNARFNSPTFCGVCDTEARDNNDIIGKVNYFLSSNKFGNQTFIGGVERFAERRFANNYQSGSNYRLFVNSVQRIGNTLYPTLVPGTGSSNAYIVWTPIEVLQANKSDLATNSAFLNDRWDLNTHWSFNLGVRYDKNDATDSSGNKVAKDSRFSPRLSATYDLAGNGKHRLILSYADYASRIVEGPGTASASAGSPGYIYYAYQGPAINPAGTPAGSLVDTRTALQTVFDWFLHQCNAAGQCGPDNLALLAPNRSQSLPGYDTRIASDLSSPYVREYTVGYGTSFGSNAFARVDLVSRDWKSFYAFRVDRTTPQLVDPLGISHDVAIVENTDLIQRKYRGAQFQASWRPNRFNFGLNYTYSTLKGNDEQESATSGTVGNTPGQISYPELRNYSQRLPVGYLSQDQRHRARAWVGYDVPMPHLFGLLNISLLENYDSGTPYSAVGSISLSPYRAALLGNAPYVGASNNQQYYFSKRGQYRLDDVSSTDLALNYNYPIGKVNLFAEGDLINMFNRKTVTIVSTTIRTSRTAGAGLVPFNPFTTTPIECPQGASAATCTAMGANWQKAANFGTPTSATASTPGNSFTSNFQTARTYRVSVGVRF